VRDIEFIVYNNSHPIFKSDNHPDFVTVSGDGLTAYFGMEGTGAIWNGYSTEKVPRI
jgi:hypothetical protein